MTLEYDNAAQSSGDVLQLRFTHVSPDLDGSNWQATAMFDNVGAAAVPDDDGDGQSNHYEFVVGLNPQVLDCLDFAIGAGSVDFTVPGTTVVTGYGGLARRYQLLHSTDMVDWTPVPGVEGVADGSPVAYPVPAGETRGFYRLSLTLE